MWRGVTLRKLVTCAVVLFLLVYSVDFSFLGRRSDKSHQNYAWKNSLQVFGFGCCMNFISVLPMAAWFIYAVRFRRCWGRIRRSANAGTYVPTDSSSFVHNRKLFGGIVFVSAYTYLEAKGQRTILLDSPSCKIPLEIEIPSVVQTESARCDENRPAITYVHGNRIFVNSTFQNARCCYRGIIRKEGCDSEIMLDPECVQINSGDIVVSFDAIVVICTYESTVYDDYHAIVHRKHPSYKVKGDPPSILMIGLDSVSRFHYHTLMPKTKRVLDGLGAIEMLGYTKVGENTFPNAIAFLTGYEEDQVSQFCYNRTHPIDSCPFIWHDLRMATALLEDAPRLGIFNYYRYGFFTPPTDHYLRPLMLSVLNDFFYTKNIFPCVGSRTTEAFIVDHIRELHSVERPLFLFSWLTSLAHEDTLSLPRADILFSEFFSSLNLSNTIVIFMSDHGHRYGVGRTTYNGWYNEKLPFFTITLPARVKSFLGERRVHNLMANAKVLTTPFDAYRTVVEILNLYKSRKVKDDEFWSHGIRYPRTRGVSLLSPISNSRTCDDAGVPQDFCACGVLQGMDIKDPLLEKTARHALARINKRLPSRCSQLSVAEITGGAALNEKEFVVGFTTKPGGFRLETMGLLNGTMSEYRVPRVSKIAVAWCVNDWFLELYCHCNLLGLLKEFIVGN